MRQALKSVLAFAAVLVAAVAVGWWVVRPTSVEVRGVDLGRLPARLARSDLNLLIVSLDTTRADRIGAYGYRDVATPALDRLAREGVLFEHAMTTAPLTLPAHASLFTAKFPPEHGVRDNGGFFLAPEQQTLAEVLGGHGFDTAGFVAAFVLDSKWGIDQGFKTFVDDFDFSKSRGISLSMSRPGNEVVDSALAWLEGHAGGRFFTWVHLYDPHTPYAPPEPFKSQYPGRPYVGEVAFADAQVGRLVDFLERRGLLDKTIVVAIGDHGESLGDHDEGSHGFFIYEPVAHVPFIVRAPFDTMHGRRIADPVRNVDVMPTVLDLLAVETPANLSGVSLIPLMTGATREMGLEGYAEAMYPLHHFGWSDLRALRSGRFKLIAAPSPELFDLELDPGETTNVFESRRSLGDRMLGSLKALESRFVKAAQTDSGTPDVDPEVRARLSALGYVGSFVATASADRDGLADPKAKIHLFNLMTEARDLSKEDGTFPAVVGMLDRVVKEDPKVIDAWFMLGSQHYKEGRYDDAVRFFKKALALKPDYDIAVINMANAYRQLGQEEAALAGYEHYLTLDPNNAYVWYMLGEIFMDRGDLEEADRRFARSLAIDEKVAPAQNALGVLAFKRGDSHRAEQLIRKALEIKNDVRLAHYNLALIAEDRGDVDAALKEYRSELELHPTTYKAAFNLSRLYAGRGDRAAEIGALKQSIEGNPKFAEGHLFLAKAYLDGATNLDEAITLARKGLELGPTADLAPLGHYVLADAYNRQGRAADAAREASLGRALENRTKAQTRSRSGA